MFIDNIDEDKKREKIEGDINRNIFVEAGAGAGKTTLIVKRIMNQLRQGWKPENIVVITFTNKAAAELYDRITTKLHEEVEKARVDKSSDFDTLNNALLDMDRMQISTIHSFCHRLLSENAFEAGIRLDAKLIDENDRDELYSGFLKDWYEKLEVKEREKLSGLGAMNYSWLLGAFLDIVDMPEDYEIVLDRELLKHDEAYYEKLLEPVLEGAFAKAAEIYNSNFNPGTDKDIEKLNSEGVISKAFYDCKTAYDKKQPLVSVKKMLDKSLSGVYTLGRGNKEQADKMSKEVEKYVRESYDKDAEYESFHYNVIMSYALKARDDFSKLRKTEKYNTCLTNDMLLQLADKLVAASEKVRKKYENTCLYVDEFQDTDHIQADMIMQLCKGSKGELRDGSLFVVGDPKQSIYRFRGAEVEVYESIKKDMGSRQEADVYILENNFRSNESIVTWVNNNFSGKIENYQPMVSGRDKNNTNNAGRIISGVYTACNGLNVGEMIKKCVEGSFLIADRNEAGGLRPVRYRDFLVLSWKTGNMEKLYKSFMELEIPVDIAGRISVSESRAMNIFLRLFKALVYPNGIKRHSYQAAYGILKNKLEKEEYVQENITDLRRKTRGMDGYGVARYLVMHPEYLLQNGENAIDKYELVSVQIRLEQMIQSAMQEECMGKLALAEFFENYLNTMVEREISLEDDRNAIRFMNVHKAKGLEGNIVVILKGDEKSWDKESSYRVRKGEKYECYEVIRPKSDIPVNTALVSYAGYDEIRAAAMVEIVNEQERLDYVAATRAKEALIVEGAMAAGDTANADTEKKAPLLELDYSDCKEIMTFLDDENTESSTETGAENGTADGVEVGNESETETVAETEIREYSGESCMVKICDGMSDSMLLDLTPSDFEINLNLDKKETEENKETRPKGNIFGNIMHRSFELLVNEYRKNRNWDAARAAIPICVSRALMENCDDMDSIHSNDGGFEGKMQEYREYLEQNMQDFLDDSEMKKRLEEDGVSIYTELAFSYVITKAENSEFFEKLQQHFDKKNIEVKTDGQTIWIHGFSDLVLYNEEKNEITIIDYKSDSKGNASYEDFTAHLEGKYAGQISLYDQSMQRLFKDAKVKETIFYSLYRR